ncbi:hypothetical protein DRO31_05225 [Candidatus Bathyarchaeota archaeon]|nr:MAG: hypothetical protein DRO31_05225 [Candidatus Bathyarchaeota archaeon]
MIYATGHISGTHINPSVTIGLATAGRFPWKLVVLCIVAQFIRAFIADPCLYGFYSEAGKTIRFGSTLSDPDLGITDGAAVIIELLLTFWLVFTIMGSAIDKKHCLVGLDSLWNS